MDDNMHMGKARTLQLGKHKGFSRRLRETLEVRGLSPNTHSRKDLGKRWGVGASFVSDLLNAHKLPAMDTLKIISLDLDVNSDWLLTGRRDDNLGSIAESIPTYNAPEQNVERLERMATYVPLISYTLAGDWTEAIDLYQPNDAEAWFLSPFPHSRRAFLLRVIGSSMLPDYPENGLILVEPETDAQHGDDVVVRTPDGKVTFKRLQITPDGMHLLAINPEYPNRIITIPQDSRICGVVTGYWVDKRRSK